MVDALVPEARTMNSTIQST